MEQCILALSIILFGFVSVAKAHIIIGKSTPEVIKIILIFAWIIFACGVYIGERLAKWKREKIYGLTIIIILIGMVSIALLHFIIIPLPHLTIGWRTPDVVKSVIAAATASYTAGVYVGRQLAKAKKVKIIGNEWGNVK